MTIYLNNLNKGAVFINAARGSLVDTKALLSNIDSQHIKGAALDTYEYERGVFPINHQGQELNDALLDELIEREDIILSYTDAAVKNLIVDALDATLDVLNTGTTHLRVN